MKPSCNWLLLAALATCLMLLNTGCYRYTILRTNETASTDMQTVRVCSYLWGIIDGPSKIEVDNCAEGNSLTRVVVKTNIGGTIITIATLGIVSPMKVQWECGKDVTSSSRQPNSAN